MMGAGISIAVAILWFVIAGMFANVPSLPYGGAIILAILLGLVFTFWNFTSNQIDEFLKSTLGRFIVVIGYIAWFCFAVHLVNENKFLKSFIDLSPRGQWFISLLVVTLAHWSASSGFHYIFQIEKPIFRNMTVSAFLSASLLFILAEAKQPNELFNPETGAPVASVDSEGTIHHNRTYSPSTGEKLSPITKEEAKKIKPWWQDASNWLKNQMTTSPSNKTLRTTRRATINHSFVCSARSFSFASSGTIACSDLFYNGFLTH
mgnify:CR=1 FL=1